MRAHVKRSRVSAGRYRLCVALGCIGICFTLVGIAWCQNPAGTPSGNPSFTLDEDPRDAKLRELEARLAKTEKQLSNQKPVRPLSLTEEPAEDDEETPAASVAQSR